MVGSCSVYPSNILSGEFSAVKSGFVFSEEVDCTVFFTGCGVQRGFVVPNLKRVFPHFFQIVFFKV